MDPPQSSPADGPPQGENIVWNHVIVTTNAGWLDGDVRGFRTRHHREHVEGNHEDPPPPELYAARRQHSRESLRDDPVYLEPTWRPIIGQALVQRFQGLTDFVLCAAMSRQHGHLLMKLPNGVARAWTGLAKKHAWFVARDAGRPGKLWGVRSQAVTVRDRAHQLNVYRRILAYEKEGAWVWKWQPAWVLLPFASDWRWLTDREDSPWYPSLRLFRQQKPGEWTPVFARLAEELHMRIQTDKMR